MTRNYRFRCKLAGLVCALHTMALVCGCSGPKAGGDVSGRVTLSGKPVKFAVIKVQGENGQNIAMCELDEGFYRLDGLTPGSYKVAIIAKLPEFQDKVKRQAITDPNWIKRSGYVELSERYGHLQSTPLSLEVTTEPQTKDFDLEP
jgi:hypothetical protein